MLRAKERIEDVIQTFVKLSEDAELHRLEEHQAAIKIQRALRRKLVGFMLRRWNRAATDIQRLYRGHLGRVRFKLKQIEVGKENRLAFFDAKATSIQRVYRGFHSRKYVHSFYDRKRFIVQSLGVGDMVRKDVHCYNLELRHQELEHVVDRVKGRIQNYWLASHHLISSQSRNGTFYSPYVAVLKGVNDIDDKIVEAMKENQRERMVSEQRCTRKPNMKGRGLSSWAVEVSEFVLTKGPYGLTLFEQRREREKLAKLLDVGEQEWRSVVRHQRLGDLSPSIHVPSVCNVDTKWHDKGKLRLQEQRKSRLLQLNIAPRAFFISPPKKRRFSCGPLPPLGS